MMCRQQFVAMRLGIVGPDCKSPSEAGNSLVQVAQLYIDIPQIIMGLGEFGLDLKGLPVTSHGLVQHALTHASNSEIIMHGGRLRLYRKSFPVAGDGLVRLVNRVVNAAQIVVVTGIGWVGPDGVLD